MPTRIFQGNFMKKAANIFFFSIVLISTIAWAGVPSVSQVEVTDATPGSFAVTWLASEPSIGTLLVFQADCATPLTGLPMTAKGSDATGYLKVTVSGLAADTSYCYQTSTTSKSTSELTVSPASPALVVTATAVLRTRSTGTTLLPFANDLLRTPAVYLPTEADTPEGKLVVLYLDGAKGPVSLLLTSDEKTRYFNMNNLFEATTGSSVNLIGGERVRISERHGLSGCVIDRFRKVPADQETTRIRNFETSPKREDIDFNGTVNILDILRAAGGLGSAKGDVCFNSELDVTGHDRVDQQDLNSVIGSFDAKP